MPKARRNTGRSFGTPSNPVNKEEEDTAACDPPAPLAPPPPQVEEVDAEAVLEEETKTTPKIERTDFPTFEIPDGNPNKLPDSDAKVENSTDGLFGIGGKEETEEMGKIETEPEPEESSSSSAEPKKKRITRRNWNGMEDDERQDFLQEKISDLQGKAEDLGMEIVLRPLAGKEKDPMDYLNEALIELARLKTALMGASPKEPDEPYFTHAELRDMSFSEIVLAMEALDETDDG
jgi:hypothetical protein